VRKLHGYCVLLLILVGYTGFALPRVGDKYCFMRGEDRIYLEMEISLLESVLGQPDEVVRYKRQDPNHAYDLVCYKYGGLWIYFDDLAAIKEGWKNYVAFIALGLRDKNYTFGAVTTGEISEIESMYGVPEETQKTEKHLIYRYYVDTGIRFFYYVLEFYFDQSNVCTQVVIDLDSFVGL